MYNIQSTKLLIKIENGLWKSVEWKCKILMLKIFLKLPNILYTFGKLINVLGT